MATKKQRKRSQKERRHEYEKVWLHPDGTVSDEPPDDYVESAPRDAKSKPQKARQQTQQRATRVPQEPSWRRSIRRSAILGAVFLVVFSLLQGVLVGLVLAVVYSAIFIPFTYYLDRFAYRRWEKTQTTPKKR